VSASLPTAAPRRMASLAPALRVAGPEGTRILVNDSLELEAPSPLEGWALPAGLLKLVVTHPDLAQPISTSLFAAADTLYILDLQADGGFSVSRRRR
ncbi:MAG TPA: hypothetical protein VK465_16400, partial [Fibrobacteria bacterium]|nr:hypothetical protein [Fibrobacteria bacterium]